MGKTCFVLAVASHFRLEKDLPVAYFSLEMSEAELLRLLTCAESNITRQEYDALPVPPDTDFPTPRIIEAPGGLSVAEIRAQANDLIAEHGPLGLIVVDYLQRLNSFSQAEATHELKELAGELGCPILVLSQLAPAADQRVSQRPMLADLPDSGIENEADAVLLLYRPAEGVAEVVIGKPRSGPVDSITLGFQPEYACFVDLAESK
jgi:replicative DNA helicase